MKIILDDFLEDASRIKNIIERAVKLYYLTGLRNRLIFNKDNPKPKCVALRNHIRILPNGDVPVCLYNPAVVGNILNDSFSGVWTGGKIKELRSWVNNCKGCWAECEVIPSAVFSLGMAKYLLGFFRKAVR